MQGGRQLYWLGSLASSIVCGALTRRAAKKPPEEMLSEVRDVCVSEYEARGVSSLRSEAERHSSDLLDTSHPDAAVRDMLNAGASARYGTLQHAEQRRDASSATSAFQERCTAEGV